MSPGLGTRVFSPCVNKTNRREEIESLVRESETPLGGDTPGPSTAGVSAR